MIAIGNAAGDCKRLEQVIELAKTPANPIMLGSILHQERAGNEGETFNVSADGMSFFNSRGLPCPGKDYYVKHLSEMAKHVHNAGKDFHVSIAGFNEDDYEITAAIAAPYAHGIEINLGCPNVWTASGGVTKQKPIASFDLDYARTIILRVRATVGSVSRINIKLSPYSDPMQLAHMAKLAAELGVGVVTSNAFPNALMFGENGKPLISVGTGLAGFSGPAFKPIALGQVAQFSALLPAHLELVGVGGIRSGADVLDFIRAGARKKVQIGAHLFHFGAKVFQEIALELPESEVA